MFPALFEETRSEEQLKKDKHERKVIPCKEIINLFIIIIITVSRLTISFIISDNFANTFIKH